MTASPNDSAHRHGNTNPTPAERAAKLQQATEEVHEAVFGAASCSSPIPEGFVFVDTTGVGDAIASMLKVKGIPVVGITGEQARVLLGDKFDALRFRPRLELCGEGSKERADNGSRANHLQAKKNVQSDPQLGKFGTDTLNRLEAAAQIENCLSKLRDSVAGFFQCVGLPCEVGGGAVGKNDLDQTPAKEDSL